MTVAEAAKVLGFTHQQTLNRVKRKKLKGKKKGWIWLVSRSSVESELKSQTPKK